MGDYKLESKLMKSLKALSEAETNAIKILIAMHINRCNKIKKEKNKSFYDGITGQINFYGRTTREYQLQIDNFEKKYSELINTIIDKYDTKFETIINELQSCQNNQKVAIANSKICIDADNLERLKASIEKKNNYEIIIQECVRQLNECEDEMTQKINEIFYNKNNALTIGKQSVFQRFINIFTGKSKVEKFVINSTKNELEQLDNIVQNEVNKIDKKAIFDIAIIKDAQIKTQNIFNKKVVG